MSIKALKIWYAAALLLAMFATPSHAQISWLSVTPTATSATVPPGTKFNAGMTYSVRTTDQDSVNHVELVEGNTVLSSIDYKVTYKDREREKE